MGGHGSTASALPTGMRVVSEPLFAGRPGLPAYPARLPGSDNGSQRACSALEVEAGGAWAHLAGEARRDELQAHTLSPGDSQRGLPHGGALRRASPVASSIEKAEAGFAVHGLRL